MASASSTRGAIPQLHLREIRPSDPDAAGQFAWQVFDSKIIPMLRDEYRIKRVTKVRAIRSRNWSEATESTPKRPLETILDLHKAVMTEVPFDPKSRRPRTRGLAFEIELGQHGGPGPFELTR